MKRAAAVVLGLTIAWAVFSSAMVAMHTFHAWDHHAYSRLGIHYFWLKMLGLLLSPLVGAAVWALLRGASKCPK